MAKLKPRLLTPEMAMASSPCPDYDEERVKRLLGEGLTFDEVIALDIPPRDRFWALCVKGFLADNTIRLIAAGCAEWALTREREQGREPDKRSWKAVEVAKRHANGKATDNELDDARADAGLASWAAAADADMPAYWAAARAASWAAMAAASAAASAALAADWDADRDADRDAAWSRFIGIAKEVVENQRSMVVTTNQTSQVTGAVIPISPPKTQDRGE